MLVARSARVFLPVWTTLSRCLTFVALGVIFLLAACSSLPNDLTGIIPATPTTGPAATGWGIVAYVNEGDIWVKALPGGSPQRLTSDGFNSEPGWSPSGRWLAYRKLDSQLWLHELDTGVVRAVDKGAPVNFYGWSPSADVLAYVVGSGVLHLRTLVAGSADSTILTPPSPAAGPGAFAWSPDGSALAYVWHGAGEDGGLRQEIRLQPVAGGDATTLYDGGDPVTGPSLDLAGWLPSGQGLLIYRGPRLVDSFLPEAVDLLLLPVVPQQAAEDPTTYAPDVSWWFLNDLAPRPGAGDQVKETLAIVTGDGPVWTAKRVQVAGAPVTPPDQTAIQPAWSPDGRELAYSGMPDPGTVPFEQAGQAVRKRSIWIAAASDASPARRLTNDPAYRDERPHYSADGGALLFARLDAANHASLWLIPAQGGQPHRVVDRLDLIGAYDDFKLQVDWEKSFDWFP